MKRVNINLRKDYVKKLEELSFEFHSLDSVYWDESHHYEFGMQEIIDIERVTNELYQMCLKAVEHVIDNNLFDKLNINPKLIPLIKRSWDNEEASIYSRFDLAYDEEKGSIKMLEINADTPTSLYEGAVVQWYWLQDHDKKLDQFNSIHERILEYWKDCIDYFNGEIIHFTCLPDNIEDFTTVEYLRDLASQAGLKTEFVYLPEIGWDKYLKEFVDAKDQPIKNIFKLYPWEWLIEEEFGRNLSEDRNNSKWIEPAWKAILSNKAILAILWELFPNHPNLLPTYFDDHKMVDYVVKPFYSREGQNVSIYKDKKPFFESVGEYESKEVIYQEYFKLPSYDQSYVILGSWIIDGESAGMGIRESDGLITDNLSRFVPHLIK